MASLPDIPTSNVSLIAYWNATNHGVNSISPSDVTSWGSISTTEAYDNGLEGTYNPPVSTNSVHHWRVKSDGWIITWVERGEGYDANTSGTSWAEGMYTTVNNWNNGGNVGRFDQNSLERGIQDLYAQLSNSGSITYNTADVGLYCYEFPQATGATCFSDYSTGGGAGGNFQYTAGTNVLYAAAGGEAFAEAGGSWVSASVDFEGVTIASGSASSYSEQRRYGAIDILEEGILNDAGQDNNLSISSDSMNGTRAGASVLVIWG